MMNKLYVSLPKLSFWKGVFEFARFIAVISYLRVLSERNNYVGFWLVVVIFSFDPIVKAIQSRKGKG
jgi:uncharacterized membrane-anchored protein